MVRNELWSDSPESLDRRLAIYAVIAFALKTLDLLLHPVSPYMTEYLYQETFLDGAWKRPLLVQDFPQVSMPATAQAGQGRSSTSPSRSRARATPRGRRRS